MGDDKYMVHLVEYEMYERVTKLYYYNAASFESNLAMQAPLAKLYRLERDLDILTERFQTLEKKLGIEHGFENFMNPPEDNNDEKETK